MSKASTSLIVMYHYVRDDPRMHAFAPERFRDQVKWLAANYEFASIGDVIRHPDAGLCCLTFDDGLRDGYRQALPVMRDHGALGAFFVPTCTIVRRRVVPAQKRALLLATLGADAVIDGYNRLVPPLYRIEEGRAFDEYNDPKVSILKYMLDHMEHDLSDSVIDSLFAAHFDEDAVFDDLYLTPDEMLELHEAGHVVGSHGHDHRWLGNLYPQDQRRDLEASIEILSDLLGRHPGFISYPFGSRNEITVRLVRELGFEGALLDPTSAVRDPNPWETNRVDCIDVKAEGPPDPLARRTKVRW